ncbi:MAG TPA: metallophosphoesterase [Polyangiaceae bacterium]|nr:metallophosphoesterase [Polyangiaceae bacterium]
MNVWPLAWAAPEPSGTTLAWLLATAIGVSSCDVSKNSDSYGPTAETGTTDSPSTGTSTSTTAATANGTTTGGATTSTSTTGAAEPTFALYGAPLVVAPTHHSFTVSAVVQSGDPAVLRARVRLEGASEWSEALPPSVRATDLAEWTFDNLEPGTRYEYDVTELTDAEAKLHFEGSTVTQREPEDSFSFALLSDTHIGAYLEYTNQGYPETLQAISAEVSAAAPDFMLNLGDMLDFHQFGFNLPPPSGEITRLAYQNYRWLLGNLAGHVGHFPVIGNWDGEAGSFTAEQIAWSREQRQLYVPAPAPDTYPEGGGPGADYYAFTWGDALFIVLNVMSYTTAEHVLNDTEAPDDWTLGVEQLAWFQSTLENATSKWRFVFIHHTVGGAAGDAANSAYGRGGGQAAYVGEQATVHALMLEHGVQIFFYGHDHVFADMVVDGIHYSMPGSAGAPWKFTEAETGYAQYWDESGWGLVDVSPDSVHVKFIALGGVQLFDYTLE